MAVKEPTASDEKLSHVGMEASRRSGLHVLMAAWGVLEAEVLAEPCPTPKTLAV